MQRLVDEIKNSSTVQAPESSTSASQSGDSMADKEAEVETLTGLCSELEKKVGLTRVDIARILYGHVH